MTISHPEMTCQSTYMQIHIFSNDCAIFQLQSYEAMHQKSLNSHHMLLACNSIYGSNSKFRRVWESHLWSIRLNP